tara:strand:- start:1482 stop:2042 length:561 start_codon:yes stop_codon:yes gene_type:complete
MKDSDFFIFFLTIVFLISFTEWIKISNNNVIKIIGIFFLLFSLYCAYKVRDEYLVDFLMILIICISTDLGGYIFGKLLKGPKLIKISPNKTYSGMFGGFLLALLFSYSFNNIYELSIIGSSSLRLMILTLLISSVSQIGDLIISYFKRLSKIKDTGKIFPGHGGMLDRIDGMIFVFPFIFIISILL